MKVPEELKRLRAEILSKGSGLLLVFINSVRHYAVAFVAIPDTQTESPWPCGSATRMSPISFSDFKDSL